MNFDHVTDFPDVSPNSAEGMFSLNNVVHDHVHGKLCYTSEGQILMCDDDIRLLPHFVGGYRSQMNFNCWDYYLNFEEDVDLKMYLSNGIQNGFPIVDRDVCIESYRCSNYKSVMSGPAFQCINDLILEEIKQGKYIKADFLPHCIHALGAVPKSDGTYRPITDCKRPIGFSINNHMNETFRHFSYTTVDQVAERMTQGCYMASVDIASAYRSIAIDPEHWKYQAINWPVDDISCDLFDTHMSFGLRCAPYSFTMISDFITRTMDKLGYHYVVNYLDDFLIYGDTFQECQEGQTVLIHLLGQLGFRVSWKKCSSPSTFIKYLGINFNSVTMELSLPEDKLRKLHQEMEFFDNRTRATKKQIQRLCGILSHSSKVIKGGRTFSRRVIDLLKSLPEGNPRIRLTSEFRKDLQWWRDFAKDFNGKEKVILEQLSYSQSLFTDSCLQGYGLVLGNDWQAGYFSSDIDLKPDQEDTLESIHKHWVNVDVPDHSNINFLELVPVMQALERFHKLWSDRHIVLYSDNTQVVAMINKGTSANVHCMSYIRHMFWICAKNNIHITARHIPGESNFLPDLLSRVYFSGTLSDLNGHSLCCRGAGAD